MDVNDITDKKFQKYIYQLKFDDITIDDIIKCEKNQSFLFELEKYIDDEIDLKMKLLLLKKLIRYILLHS